MADEKKGGLDEYSREFIDGSYAVAKDLLKLLNQYIAEHPGTHPMHLRGGLINCLQADLLGVMERSDVKLKPVLRWVQSEIVRLEAVFGVMSTSDPEKILIGLGFAMNTCRSIYVRHRRDPSLGEDGLPMVERMTCEHFEGDPSAGSLARRGLPLRQDCEGEPERFPCEVCAKWMGRDDELRPSEEPLGPRTPGGL